MHKNFNSWLLFSRGVMNFVHFEYCVVISNSAWASIDLIISFPQHGGCLSLSDAFGVFP
jgi:hypothetical protein